MQLSLAMAKTDYGKNWSGQNQNGQTACYGHAIYIAHTQVLFNVSTRVAF